MSVRGPATVAGAALVMSAVVWAGAIWLAVGRTTAPFGAGDVLWGLSFLAVQGVGAIVLRRHPDNAAARYFVAAPLFIALGVLGSDYAGAVIEGRVALPGPAWAALLGSASFVAGVGLLALALYRFPDGRPLGPIWLVAERVLLGALALQVLVALLEPTLLDDPAVVGNPLTGGAAVPGLGALEATLTATQPVLVGGLLSLVSLVVRWRRGDGATRRQLTWVLYPVLVGTTVAAALATIEVVVELSSSAENAAGVVVTVLFTLGVPFGILMAMTRARLYDLDRLVSRTVSYALVSAVLVAVYLASVLGLRALLDARLGAQSDIVVAVSTLVVAALFGPLRRRTQALVDRRFDRPRLDRQRTVDTFVARLRDEVDRDAVVDDLTTTVTRALGPNSVGVWQPGR